VSQPKASRPHIPHYGIPKSLKGTLSWDYVAEQMEKSLNYWIVTVRPDDRPHSVPVWGVWVEGKLYFSGGLFTQWARNLSANPNIAVHLESAERVVILEGEVKQIDDPAHPLVGRINDAYQTKYRMPHQPPFWELHPRVVLGWTAFPRDATRWVPGEQ